MAGETNQTADSKEVVVETDKEVVATKIEFSPEQQAKVDEIVKTRTEEYREKVGELKSEIEEIKSALSEPDEPAKPATLSQTEWDALSDKQKIALVAKEEFSPEIEKSNAKTAELEKKLYKLEWKNFKSEHKDLDQNVEKKMVEIFKTGRATSFEDAYELAKDKTIDKEAIKKEIIAEMEKDKEVRGKAGKVLQPNGGSQVKTGDKPMSIEDSFKKTLKTLGV